jgi:hypothetical protein
MLAKIHEPKGTETLLDMIAQFAIPVLLWRQLAHGLDRSISRLGWQPPMEITKLIYTP